MLAEVSPSKKITPGTFLAYRDRVWAIVFAPRFTQLTIYNAAHEQDIGF